MFDIDESPAGIWFIITGIATKMYPLRGKQEELDCFRISSEMIPLCGKPDEVQCVREITLYRLNACMASITVANEIGICTPNPVGIALFIKKFKQKPFVILNLKFLKKI
jgi:hypothetical protein